MKTLYTLSFILTLALMSPFANASIDCVAVNTTGTTVVSWSVGQDPSNIQAYADSEELFCDVTGDEVRYVKDRFPTIPTVVGATIPRKTIHYRTEISRFIIDNLE